MNQELINKINCKCPYDQGIFSEPYGIPTHIKELVVYTKYSRGGYSGGSCWGDEAEYHYESEPTNKWEVLDLILEELIPDITLLEYKKIEKLIHDNHETQYEYYGNSTEYKIEYIILSELELLIMEIKANRRYNYERT